MAKVVMAYQLDGEFMAWFDGVGTGAFPTDRARTTLHTLKRVAMEPWGSRVWTNPDASTIKPGQFNTGYWTPHGVHVPSALWLAASFMYHGDKEFGLELARRTMLNMICRQGWAWDMPILFRGDTGEGIWGNDYAQMMAVWVLPAAIKREDLSGPAKPGGLVYRMIQAGSKPNRGARALYSLILFALERSRGAGTPGGVLSLRRQLPHERAHPS